MQTADTVAESSAVDLARECLYRFLSVVVTGPYAASWSRVQEAKHQRLVLMAVELLRAEADSDPRPLARGELPPKDLESDYLMGELQKPIADLRADYDGVFGLVIPPECPPYETEYHPPSETFFRSQQMADIAGFYRAFGIEPASALPERPDHLALELEFMAFLLTKQRLAFASADSDPDAAERASVCDLAQNHFFSDHLAWWVPAFATGLQHKARSGYLYALARLLAALIPAERHRLGIDAPHKLVQPSLIEQPEVQAGCMSCSLRT